MKEKKNNLLIILFFLSDEKLVFSNRILNMIKTCI